MRVIESDSIVQVVKNMCIKINYDLVKRINDTIS